MSTYRQRVGEGESGEIRAGGGREEARSRSRETLPRPLTFRHTLTLTLLTAGRSLSSNRIALSCENTGRFYARLGPNIIKLLFAIKHSLNLMLSPIFLQQAVKLAN